jgi:hypothetical protein
MEGVVTALANSDGNGFFPVAGVIFDKKSATLYGVTTQGGNDGWGAVYQVVLP